MATTTNVSVIVYYNGECGRDQYGVFFGSDEKKLFIISTRSTLAQLKERIVKKLNLGDNKVISGIIYRVPVIFGSTNKQFESLKIEDDEDVESMFHLHVHSKFPAIVSIELCVTFEDVHSSQPPNALPQQHASHFQSQPSWSTYAPYTRFNPQSPHIHSQSSSTCAPYDQQHVEEPHTQQEVGDESESELDYVKQLFGNDGIEAGMQFHDKADCVAAIRHYHIKQSLDYVVKQSDPDRYVIKCVHRQCPFSLRASYRKTSKHWVIGRISGSHECGPLALSHDHRKLDSNVICHSIESLVRNDLSIKVNDIIAHIKEKFNGTITSRKAWIVKNKAIEKIYGTWQQSYHDLPQWLMVMRSYLPGTIVQMETLPATYGSYHWHGNMFFHRLFWAFNLCIKGFTYCKPIVQVDGTWLYGKYKGTLLIAVTHDGNNNIFPLAFAVVEGETKDAWSFFLKNLRRHVTPQPNICLISNRNPSIESAYNNPENGWNDPPSTHVYCLRRIAQNFMQEIKDKQLRETIVNMGYAINKPLFQQYRDKIRLTNLEALRWVDNIPKEKWTRAYDGGCRWGHMTTSLVETMNSVLKDIRNKPITAMVQSTYYRCATLFAERGKQAATILDSSQDYTEQCMNHIVDAVQKATTHQIVRFDQQNHTYSVRETVNHNEGQPMRIFKVNLDEKWCDCGKFQSLHLPCSHVIAICSGVRRFYQVYISDVYTVADVFRIYDESFQVVQNKGYWPEYQGNKLWGNPEMNYEWSSKK
ncbi:hypothetical protein TSUD_378090 [Trifolium subterraneum]|uniref:SWIM-type domain-containing protein n=1 Tax=Trifolium subterraneum TaxID=3900 RepID=A0A2Z6NH32_TRISU|nr:hypothetical protein TSUD_378090 [Trifolium subterraneum]